MKNAPTMSNDGVLHQMHVEDAAQHLSVQVHVIEDGHVDAVLDLVAMPAAGLNLTKHAVFKHALHLDMGQGEGIAP